ncbi:MAG: protein kinase [Pseudomonadota bacterium]
MLPGRIGDYQILAEIGRGGMGVVFRARDERTGQDVALKMLAPEAQSHKDSALRFKREFRAIRRVVHPNVVRVFEAGAYHGSPYFSMELVDGKNIRRWLDGDEPIVHVGKDPPPAGPLSEAQQLRLNEPARIRRLAEATVQVCFALGTIHAHRIVHRDLKPDNILVTPQGVVKLMDFGIAKQLTDQGPSTSGGMVVGTFKYLSPEQALGLEVDGRADLYCLGIVLYELLAGRHPFYSETSVGYAYHHARTTPPPVTRYNPDVERGIAGIAERLLAKEPGERFATAEDLIAGLKEAVSGIEERVNQLRASTKRFALPPFQLSPHPLYAPALVGRDREKQTLLTAIDRLRSGVGRLVVIEGAAGGGKSRLLRTIAAETKDQGVHFLFGRANQNERAPYAPFVEIFDHLIRQLAQQPRREVNRILGTEGPALARYIPAVAALPMVESRQAPALAPEDEQIRFRAAVADVLARYCHGSPHVLVLDDLHLADELSLDLVRHLAGALAGLLVDDGAAPRPASLALFIAHDSDAVPPPALTRLLAELEGQTGFVRVGLSPLDAAAGNRLVRSMLGGAEVAAAFTDALHAGTGGNPYRIEERVRVLAEAGELVRRGRRWMLRARSSAPQQPTYLELEEVTASEVPPIPDRERGGGGHRLSNLSVTARDVAERAAVVGLALSSELLSRIALRPEEELLDALDELIKREVLAEGKSEGVYRFVNEDVRGGILEAVEPGRRARHHLLAAHSLEEIARADPRIPADPEVLATHYLEGGEPRRAFDYLAQAAHRAVQANAVQAATSLVERARETLREEIEHNPADPGVARRRIELLQLRLAVILAAGHPAEAIEVAHHELDALRGHTEARHVAEVIYLLARAELTVGELDNGLRHVAEVVAVTERGGAHVLRCKAKRLAGDIYVRRGQSDRAQRYYRDAIDLARAIGNALEEELVRSAMAALRLDTGELAQARRDYENLLTVAEQTGERSRAAHYVKCLGLVHHAAGDYERALSSYQRALDMARAIGDSRTALVCQCCVGTALIDQGAVDPALEAFAAAREGLMAAGATEEVIESLLGSAEAYLLRDANEKARTLCDEAVAEAERSGMSTLLAAARVHRGLARVRLGDDRPGLSDIEAGLATAQKSEAIRLQLQGFVALGEALFLAGEQARGLQLLDQAQRRAESSGYLRYRDRVQNVRTRLQVTSPS